MSNATTYLRLDPTGLVAIDEFDPAEDGIARHAFVTAHGHGLTTDAALAALVKRLRLLADLVEEAAMPAATKTAYAERLLDAEVAEQTKGMATEDREEFRIENAISPLFDMWLRFQDVFTDRAIDRFDISDEDAEAAAQRMNKNSPTSGDAFAHLLRRIPDRRRQRKIFHMVDAVWAASGTSESMSMPEVFDRYAKLPKGDA